MALGPPLCSQLLCKFCQMQHSNPSAAPPGSLVYCCNMHSWRSAPRCSLGPEERGFLLGSAAAAAVAVGPCVPEDIPGPTALDSSARSKELGFPPRSLPTSTPHLSPQNEKVGAQSWERWTFDPRVGRSCGLNLEKLESPAAVVLKLSTRWGSRAESERGANPAVTAGAALRELCRSTLSNLGGGGFPWQATAHRRAS